MADADDTASADETASAKTPVAGGTVHDTAADTNDASTDGTADAAAAGPQTLSLPAGVHQLCSCGRSRQGWFCDGSHLGTGRVSHELRLSAPCTLRLCGCGRSRRYPVCDGSHAQPIRRSWWRWWRQAPQG